MVKRITVTLSLVIAEEGRDTIWGTFEDYDEMLDDEILEIVAEDWIEYIELATKRVVREGAS